MEYDEEKVDEIVLALLYLTSSRDQYATRGWKGLNWEVMDRLHEKGYIGDPREKSPTVILSESGAALSKELFFKYFGKQLINCVKWIIGPRFLINYSKWIIIQSSQR